MKNFFKKRWVKVSLTIFALLILSILALGGFYYSKTSVIDRYVKARSQKSGPVFENIKEYLVWSDTKETITNDEATFAEFSRLDKSQVKEVKEALKSADQSDDQYLVSTGRHFGIFPDYHVAMRPMSLTIKTNLKDEDILLNQKFVTRSDSDKFSTELKRLPIADYKASINGKYKGRDVEISKSYDGKNKVLDLSVTFMNFTVSSNLTDGELYFDDSRIGSLKEGTYKVEDYPVTHAAQAYVKKNFPDGDISSKKVALDQIQDGSDVKLDVDNLLSAEKAGQYLLSAFDQLMIYTSNRQDSASINDVFENGANNAFYKGLKESVKAKLETDSRKASSFAIPNVVLNNLTQVGKESYLIDFSATYDYGYDKSTDPAKSSSGHITQDINGKMTLKKSGDKYIVSEAGVKNITVVNEKNEVKAPSLLPEGLVGTWSGTKDDITYTLTFAEDGTVTRKKDYKDPKKKDEMTTAKISKSEEKSEGDYRLNFSSGNGEIMVIGGGIGGMNIKYDYGVRVEGNSITPIIWQTGSNQEFDYSKPLPGLTLKRE
ncbi:hypothetical protein A9Q68_07585 [Streptococcus bovimastitidis]|uniref:TcaA 4th domain-containing protein n=1 Tax=Streptococcus bovimastitidis TaxID=1856638 RepID=A0A1L8MM63_9STRE|nr:hypothetical protein [Streptococcus bovimastitidis]OJF71838.1 hypothetical protein A9Q68_07585 [Streptococcus bovimastitidis]